MPQLHETRMGQKLIEHDIPEIVKALQKIGEEIERLNVNLERGKEDKNK